MTECVDRLNHVVLQVKVADRWVWKLHSFQRYTVKSSYDNLTTVEIDFNMDYNHVL